MSTDQVLLDFADQMRCYIDQKRSWTILDSQGRYVRIVRRGSLWEMHCGPMTSDGSRARVDAYMTSLWVQVGYGAASAPEIKVHGQARYDSGDIVAVEAVE